MLQDDAVLEQLKCEKTKETAFSIIYKEYYRDYAYLAYQILKDVQVAEDIAQTLFVRFWQRKDYSGIQTMSDLRGFLYRSCQNLCFNYLKSKNVHQKSVDAYQKINNRTETYFLESFQIAASINAALKRMSVQRLAAFRLIYFENQNYQDAAQRMGVSINTLKVHLKKAVKELRNALQHLR